MDPKAQPCNNILRRIQLWIMISDFVSEKFCGRGGGGGVFSNPKIYIANFGPLDRALSALK